MGAIDKNAAYTHLTRRQSREGTTPELIEEVKNFYTSFRDAKAALDLAKQFEDLPRKELEALERMIRLQSGKPQSDA